MEIFNYSLLSNENMFAPSFRVCFIFKYFLIFLFIMNSSLLFNKSYYVNKTYHYFKVFYNLLNIDRPKIPSLETYVYLLVLVRETLLSYIHFC